MYKRVIAHLVLSLVGCCLIPSLIAQTLRQGYTKKDWTTEDGMPSGQVRPRLETADGYLWATSVGGLVRLDGLQVKVIGTKQIPDLNSALIMDKLIAIPSSDPNVHLPIGFWGVSQQDVFTYQNGTFRVLASLKPKNSHILKLDGDQIYLSRGRYPNQRFVVTTSTVYIMSEEGRIVHKVALAPYIGRTYNAGGCTMIDHQGRLWLEVSRKVMGNKSHTFFLVISPTGAVQPINWSVLLDPQSEYGMLEDSAHNLYFFRPSVNNESKTGIVIYNNQGVFSTQLKDTKVLDINENKKGELWALTDKGILYYHQGLWQKYSSQPEGIELIKDNGYLLFDSQQQLWAAWDNNNLTYNISLLPRVTPEASLQWQIIDSGARGDGGVSNLIETQNQHIWGTIIGDKLSQFKPQPLNQLITPKEISIGFTFKVFQSLDRSIWYPVFRENKIIQYDKKNATTSIFTLPKGESYLPSGVFEPEQGKIWAKITYGLFELEKGNFTPIKDAPIGLVRSLYKDKMGKVWVASRETGASHNTNLYTWEKGKWIHFQDFEEGVYSFAETKDGTLWVGTSQGVLYYLSQGQTQFKPIQTGITARVGNLYVDQYDILWAGTEGEGLLKIQNGRVIHKFGEDDGFPFSTIWGIHQDNNHNFWFSGDRGVMMITDAHLRNASMGQQLEPLIFGEKDGVAGKECNGGSQDPSFKDEQGVMYFPCVMGVTVVDPRKAYQLNTPILVNDKQIKGRSVIINYRYSNGRYSNVLYYRVSGYIPEWVSTPMTGQLNLSNLPSGHHIIELRTTASTAITTVTLDIPLRWYETIWFYTLTILGLLVLFYIIYWYRNNSKQLTSLIQQKEQDEAHIIQQRDELIEQKQQLEEKTELLENANTHLEEIDKAKSEFLAQINHDIRTPLSAIKWLIETHLDQSGQQDAILSYNDAQSIILQTRRLSSFMDKTMASLHDDFVQANKITPINFELIQYLEDYVVAPFCSVAEQKAVRLRFIPMQETLPIYLDPKVIDIITQNLLENALKFTSPKGLVTFTVRLENDTVCLEIKDNGKGIAEKDLPFVFDRFYKGDHEGIAGTGLGLSIVKNWVNLQSGQIDLQSEVDLGTTVTVRLPYIQPAPSVPLMKPSWNGWLDLEDQNTSKETDYTDEKESKDESTQPQTTILLVEDEFQIRQLLKQALSAQYLVLEAKNGKQALDILADHPEIDLVVTDYMMQVMNGLELQKHIRSNPETKLLPVVMLTARGTEQSRLDAIREQVDDYCDKMTPREELLLRIENVLQRYAKLRQQYAKQMTWGTTTLEVDSPAHQLMQRIEKVLEEKYHEVNFDVPALANALDMAQQKLGKLLRNHKLPTPLSLIKEFRLNRAHQLLEQPRAKALDVSEQVGFTNYETFSKDFRTHFGYSPNKVKSK
jgi:signal transduction histidine kinase/DNA-binding response OmpR family regulator/ligand-binding sensor domain-containing protein